MSMHRERFEKRLKRITAYLASRLKVQKWSKKLDHFAGKYIQPERRAGMRPTGMSARQWKKLQVAQHLGNQPEAQRILRFYAERRETPGHAFRETGVPAHRRSRRARSKSRCARAWQGGGE